LNLDEVMKDPATRFGDFWPSAISAYSEYPSGSKRYWGFPFQGDVNFIAYRKDLFEQHGKHAPTDLNEMLAHAQYFQALNNASTPYGMAAYWCSGTGCYDETSTMWNQIAWMFGGQLWDESTYTFKGIVDSAENAAALRYAQQLFDTGDKNIQVGFATTDTFCQGKAAMSIVWMGLAGAFAACTGVTQDQIAYAPVPYHSDTNIHALSLGGMELHVSAGTKQPELAVEVAAYLASYSAQQVWANSYSGYTIRKSVSQEPSFLVADDGSAKKLDGVYTILPSRQRFLPSSNLCSTVGSLTEVSGPGDHGYDDSRSSPVDDGHRAADID